jgi:hypothetical protein
MTAEKIRAWLLQQPRAASLRVLVGKERQELAVAGQSWAKLAATIEAMTPDRIEALDVGGNLLRAVRPADVDDVEQEPESSPDVLSPPPATAYDPETVRFELIARLLADAHKFSVGVAFEKIVLIVDAQNRRSESLERALASAERLLRKQAEDLFEEAEQKSQENPLQDMVNGFVKGAINGSTASTTTTNGKA